MAQKAKCQIFTVNFGKDFLQEIFVQKYKI